MKKHNEGYALPFVLVVLVVLCIITVGIMDFSLRNLQTQQATIQRMKDKYVAAGKIEEICAAAESGVKGISFPSSENGLLFLIKDNKLTIAAAGLEDGDVWIIAELISTDGEGNISQTFKKEESEGQTILTIDGEKSNTVSIVTYQVVDKDTAKAFVTPGGGS